MTIGEERERTEDRHPCGESALRLVGERKGRYRRTARASAWPLPPEVELVDLR